MVRFRIHGTYLLRYATELYYSATLMSHTHPGHFHSSDWDERYRSAPMVWSGEPSPHLVAETANLTPGSALDVGAGEGADAIWLAERGWQVTAVDISTVGLERGRKQADHLGVATAQKISWLHADLTEWEPPVASFDLVSAQFMHLPSAQRLPLYQRLADSVAPGGVLLIVGHHPSDLETTARRLPDPDPLFTANELADELGDSWTILAQDTRPRTEIDPSGQSITVHDSVLVARRTEGIPPPGTTVAPLVNAVETQNIVKTFGDIRALDGVSIQFEKGIVYGLLGPNGAGSADDPAQTRFRVSLGGWGRPRHRPGRGTPQGRAGGSVRRGG